jgi:hypothetical protein
MKNTLALLVLLFAFVSCNNEEEQLGPNINNVASQLCNNIQGAEGLYWDLSNGLPRTDLPGFMPPTVKQFGGSFLHPDFPPMSFEFPAGYSTETLRGQQTAGVNLVRQDQQVVWRWLTTLANGFPSARQLRQEEIGRMLQFFGVDASNLQLICLNEGQTSPVAGINIRRSVSLVRAGQFTALVSAEVTHVEGLPTSSVTFRMSAGPTAEYAQLVFDTFLAIEFQMLYRPEGGLIDSDEDGVADPFDREPNNPRVQ